jgi:hypothetical protein
MLVAVAAGETKDFSGAIRIAGIYQYAGIASEPVNVLAQFGVLPPSCSSGLEARPFAVAIVSKPEHVGADFGYDFSTFSDTCKQGR